MPSGAPVCLPPTTGRPRIAPLLYLQDGADYIVVATQGGAPQHPGWFLNLEAHPLGALELGAHRLGVTARRIPVARLTPMRGRPAR